MQLSSRALSSHKWKSHVALQRLSAMNSEFLTEHSLPKEKQSASCQNCATPYFSERMKKHYRCQEFDRFRIK